VFVDLKPYPKLFAKPQKHCRPARTKNLRCTKKSKKVESSSKKALLSTWHVLLFTFVKKSS
jgi:hypothetical protein